MLIFCIFHGQWHPQFGKIYIDLLNLVGVGFSYFILQVNKRCAAQWKVGRARIGSASAKDGIPGLDQLQLWLFPVSPLFPLYPKLLIALPHCCPSPHSNNNLLSSYKNGCFSVALFRLTTLNIPKYSWTIQYSPSKVLKKPPVTKMQNAVWWPNVYSKLVLL